MCCLYQDTQSPCVVVWIQGETPKEKTFEVKKQNTHTHIHTKGRENKEKLTAEKKVDQVGI